MSNVTANPDLRPVTPVIETPLRPLSDDAGHYRTHRFGRLRIDSWAFTATGNRDVDAYAHGFEVVGVSDAGADEVCVKLRRRDREDVTTTVIAFIGNDEARKLRDKLNELDLG